MSSVLLGTGYALELILPRLPLILHAYWLLAVGAVAVVMLPVPVPKAFKDAVRLSACRGKLWNDKPAALGPLKDWSVPQAWFLHFYVLGSCCNAAVLVAYCLSSSLEDTNADTLRPLLCLMLFQVHLVRRALETGLLIHYPAHAVMHGIAYLFGISYYIMVPLSLLPSTCFQRQQQQQWQSVPSVAQLPERLRSFQSTALKIPGDITLIQCIGAAVFLTGNLLQFIAHRNLANLSKDRAHGKDKSGYKIPKGGLFELVSCPHYLAEIVIYCGLVVLSGGKLLTWLILTWVELNLMLAAKATHQWYQQQFKAYPSSRRALIPYFY